MKNLILSLFVCLGLVGVSGCAMTPTAEQLANADYGVPIPKEDAVAKAEQWVRGVLKDPDSARFEWNQFEKGWARNGLAYGGGYTFGYLLTGNVNARNSFGGYVGARKYQFIFRDGEIAAILGETVLSGGGTYIQRLK